ncbi:tyrosinase [Nematocida major]|uniref:tyrosinase n=1 Tax=Nematocida major TaxID=1912982 RepID=UPI0020083AFB|nr:tyrosinase [Nematocida major]KAH9385724.1 tyrosinase [Nematocida major]
MQEKVIVQALLAFSKFARALIHTSIPVQNNPFPQAYPEESDDLGDFFINPLIAIDEEYLHIPRVERKVVRKEFRDLTQKEWKAYREAVELLRKSGYLEPLARVHFTVRGYAHNSLEFLPWHRLFLLYYEYLLRAVSGQDDITVPYWNWALDADNPSESPMLDSAHWGLTRCFLVHEPVTHCLQRTRNRKIDPFYNEEEIDRIVRKKNSFYDFTIELELIPHALVHLNLGGEYGDMSYMQSTNDPLFWHHHSYVEYIWEQRMRLYRENPRAEKYLYPQEKLDTVLYPFNMTVRQAIALSTRIEYRESRAARA